MSVGATLLGTPRDSRCFVQFKPGDSLPPPHIHPPGVGTNSFCLMLQRVVESYRGWTKLAGHLLLFCFVNLFSNVKHLIAVVRHHLKT